MSHDTNLAYNTSVFISTIFLLEFAADKFISHTAKLASRIGVSQLLVGLLTAGAEWEEVSFPTSSQLCLYHIHFVL
jgi:Ca2+/Na+ antiporter